MSSIQGPSTAFRPVTSLPVPTHTSTPAPPTTTAPATHTPSTTMLHQVQQSQGQSQALGQLTSPTVVQSGQQQIDATPAPTVDQSHQQAKSIFGQSTLGKHVETLVSVGSKTGTVVDTLVEGEVMGIKPSEKLGSLMEAVTEKTKVMGTDIELRSAESHILEHFTGISHESTELAKTVLDVGKKGLETAKALQSIQEAYQEGIGGEKTIAAVKSTFVALGGDESAATAMQSIHDAYKEGSVLSTKTAIAVKDTYVALGGDKTIDTVSKIATCCQERSLDSTKEMLESIGKLSSDDSYASQLTHLAVSTGSSHLVGETLTGGVASVLPVLSYGTTIVDTGVALKKGYDWYNGQNEVSGLDVTKSVITAIGSGTGATVAPIVGPLLATGVNLTLDLGVGTYNMVSKWWSGTTT